MQISPVRDAIATAAQTVVLPAGTAKLTCSGYTPDAITAPHFFVAEVEVTYDRTMGRGQDELQFTARALVARSDDRSSQQILDALLSGAGPASLKAAIEAARGTPGQAALGGLADDLHVVRVQGYRWYEHEGVQYIGAELIIRVIGPGGT